MFKNKRIIAVIPARSGSKRLPNKNIKNFNGYPLLYWSIIAAKKVKIIDKIYVSTNSLKIKKIAEKFGALVPFLRPAKYSTSKAPSEELILHLLKNLKFQIDYLVLLQPTSPLRNHKDVESSLKQSIKKELKSLISVTNLSEHKLNLISNTSSKIKILNKKKVNKFKYINGSIYILKVSDFLTKKKIISSSTKFFETKKNNSIDIDTRFDFEVAKLLSKKI
ncbi:acylneuraminate cytidylyltransferase family protein [Candidatus Pelagibacter sp.]|nr:acylneuraminate cytidylyltransferase family protein [Candidatus Pelagibacter sp.]